MSQAVAHSTSHTSHSHPCSRVLSFCSEVEEPHSSSRNADPNQSPLAKRAGAGPDRGRCPSASWSTSSRPRPSSTNVCSKYGYPLKSLDISPPFLGGSIRSSSSGRDHRLASADPPPSTPAPQPAAAESEPKPFTPKGIEPDETSLEWPGMGTISVSFYPSQGG